MAIQSSYFDPADGSVGTVDLAFVPVRSLRIPLTAATTTTPGAVCSVANPEGIRLLIVSAVLDEITGGTGATVNIGVATNASTQESNMFSAVETGLGGAVLGSFVGATLSVPVWGVSNFITGTASATVAGWEAVLHVQYIPA